MLKLTGNQLRSKWLEFFKSKDHLNLQSYSLIPEDDPTLLLIGAGMAPFKPFFTGKMKPPHPRIATSQKCIRTGDIENVGRTARHHTFFEMLGNFSFGDYFKKEAIPWAWEFLTEVLELPADKLWITIHPTDEEAFEIWHKDVGIPVERIIRLEDNFWEIGPGPCGPCSELYIDLGEERGCGDANCAVGCNCDRFLEIWNLVFTQYDRDEQGQYTPLAKKNIDTGAGLERIASVLQEKRSNFETDLLFPIIEHVCKVSNIEYGTNDKTDVSFKVIADHVRAFTFMIGDGVLPSNEGRGYVLRRILRRAIRHGKLMGINKPFLIGVVDVVLRLYGEPYPDLVDKKAYITRIVELEEKRFQETLDQGIAILHQHIEELRSKVQMILPGDVVFKLYDTFGFPVELTSEIAEENDMKIDEAGFKQAMQEQRERARSARAENERIEMPDLQGVVVSELKYDPNVETTTICALLADNKLTEEVHDGMHVKVILKETPFYAEGGGQVGDTGFVHADTAKLKVINTRKLPDGTIYHEALVTEGSLKKGDNVVVGIDRVRRQSTARNHTATHLLHKALKEVLGDHVNQAGSLVEPERLRFDFSHFAAIQPEELQHVEAYVNQAILANSTLNIVQTNLDTARNMGATALFGEKYGDVVRVVMIGDVSKELCGGTHVNATGEIGLFKIVSEGGVAAGVRRIEAVTGSHALAYVKVRERQLEELSHLLKTPQIELVSKTEQLLAQIRKLEKDLEAANLKLAKSVVDDLVTDAIEVAGFKVIVGKVQAPGMDELRQMADLLRDRIDSGVVVVGAVVDDKVNFVAAVTADLLKKGLHAGNLLREVAKIAGGGGGGRPDMAQAGGKNPAKLDEALAAAIKIVNSQANAG